MIHSRNCPICNSIPNLNSLFAEKNIDPNKINGFSFSSRKTPEWMCHRIVVCERCDLAFVDQPPDADVLAQAYHQAEYDSSEEASDAASTYAEAVSEAVALLPRRESALEIGAGTGVFLEHLSRFGFSSLVGVEPSRSAIASAPPHRRQWLRECMFHEADFVPGSFDIICCFMTLEHVFDPMAIAASASRLLRPGGVFVSVTHDRRGWVNRILGKRSPIVDIEHMQLFSKKSIHALYDRSGYVHVTSRAFKNTYSLSYWIRLVPLPQKIKDAFLSFLKLIHMHLLKITVNVGNTVCWGQKPF